MRTFSMIAPCDRDSRVREWARRGSEVCGVFVFLSAVRKTVEKAELGSSNDTG
jgi:hypothetical protein